MVVPMAVSLAFGVIFATFITLVLVPTAYLIIEDVKSLPRRLFAGNRNGKGRLDLESAVSR